MFSHTAAVREISIDRGLQLALRFEDGEPMRRIAQMLKKLSHNTETIQEYCSNDLAVGKKEKEECFMIFVGITKFFAEAILFLRAHDDPRNTTGNFVLGNNSIAKALNIDHSFWT